MSDAGASQQQSPTLTRARHQLAVVGIVDAFWIGFALLSLWLCSSGVLGSVSQPGLLLLGVLHVAAAIWAISLLCVPELYSMLAMVVFGVIVALLDAVHFFMRLAAVLACFPGCGFCEFWFTFVVAGWLALSLAWLLLSTRYAMQQRQEQSAAPADAGEDDDDDEERKALLAPSQYAMQSPARAGHGGAEPPQIRQRPAKPAQSYVF